ncbi:MAG: uncharacterized protein QOG80_77, partial [Pseudonocardiales bacterium]|nr:uncharacterized protein [Pseudonocardiales bacterium]
GVGTIPDLANYFGLKATDVRLAVRELVHDGVIEEVQVDGWKGPTFLATGTNMPRRIDARALLGPFDSLTWSRDRVQRLFNFAFSFEIYVPEPKRRYGYYVLPLLVDEALVGRVDLKADRARTALLVQGAYGEKGVDPLTAASALADELRHMAAWLALDRVEVVDRGDLAKHLSREL